VGHRVVSLSCPGAERPQWSDYYIESEDYTVRVLTCSYTDLPVVTSPSVTSSSVQTWERQAGFVAASGYCNTTAAFVAYPSGGSSLTDLSEGDIAALLGAMLVSFAIAWGVRAVRRSMGNI